MRDSFARIDDALIDKMFQPFVDRLRDQTDCDSFGLARLAIDCASLAWILSQAPGAALAGRMHGPLEYFMLSLIVLGLASISILRAVFYRQCSGRSGANPLRPAMHAHRAVCLLWLAGLSVRSVLSPVTLESLALLAVGIFMTIAVYAGACSNGATRRASRNWAWRLNLRSARS